MNHALVRNKASKELVLVTMGSDPILDILYFITIERGLPPADFELMDIKRPDSLSVFIDRPATKLSCVFDVDGQCNQGEWVDLPELSWHEYKQMMTQTGLGNKRKGDLF